MQKKYKSMIILGSIIILIFVNLFFFWIGYRNFLDPKLGDFAIQSLNAEDENLVLHVTDCHNAVSYYTEVYQQEEKVYETKSDSSDIVLSSFTGNYQDEFLIKVVAMNKNNEEKESQNTYSFVYEDASFVSDKYHILSEHSDLVLSIFAMIIQKTMKFYCFMVQIKYMILR